MLEVIAEGKNAEVKKHLEKSGIDSEEKMREGAIIETLPEDR